MLAKIRSEEKNIDLLLQWSMDTDQPLGWRSVWLLRQVLKKNDPILEPHIKKVLDLYASFNESQKREWLKALESQSLDDDEEGILFDHCMNEWKKIQNHPALRASAANIIFKVVKKYPELKEELMHLMSNEYLDTLSPAIKKGVVKQWNQMN